MEVFSIRFDLMHRAPVVILKDLEESVYLPIWIGLFEAAAIEMALENVAAPRPMTHDLLNSMIHTLGAGVEKIEVYDLVEGTFYAKIYLNRGEENWVVDARPSDSIALALRCDAPIFADEQLIEENGIKGDLSDEEEVERFKNFVSKIKPDDFKADQ